MRGSMMTRDVSGGISTILSSSESTLATHLNTSPLHLYILRVYTTICLYMQILNLYFS